jgi:hypothetical protein
MKKEMDRSAACRKTCSVTYCSVDGSLTYEVPKMPIAFGS